MLVSPFLLLAHQVPPLPFPFSGYLWTLVCWCALSTVQQMSSHYAEWCFVYSDQIIKVPFSQPLLILCLVFFWGLNSNGLNLIKPLWELGKGSCRLHHFAATLVVGNKQCNLKLQQKPVGKSVWQARIFIKLRPFHSVDITFLSTLSVPTQLPGQQQHTEKPSLVWNLFQILGQFNYLNFRL